MKSNDERLDLTFPNINYGFTYMFFEENKKNEHYFYCSLIIHNFLVIKVLQHST